MLTGASGVTALSPAMSFAGGRLVFSAYENDGYNIYALDTAEQLAGEPSVDLPRNAAVLPPRRDAGGLVVEALQDATWGLPGTEVPMRRAVQAEVGTRFRRSAVVRRRRRSVRDVCRRRRVVPLQRHARQSRDRHGGAGDQPVRRVWRDALLPESDAPLELGRVARPDALRVPRASRPASSATPTSSASIATSSATSPPRASSRIPSADPGAWSSPAAIAASGRATT